MDQHTEVMAFVATTRPDEALAFYRDILGLALIEDSPFALAFSTSDRMLRVQKLQDPFKPAPGTVLGWKVTDIQGEITALVSKGVTFLRFPGLPQDEHGVWTTPASHKVAWFNDPDGNTLSLTEFVGES